MRGGLWAILGGAHPAIARWRARPHGWGPCQAHEKECSVTRSVIGIRSRLDTGCVIAQTLVMGADYYESPSQREDHVEQGSIPLGVGAHTTIHKAIIDKNARIGRHVRIVNAAHVQEADQEALGFVIRNGIVVVLKNATIPDEMVI